MFYLKNMIKLFYVRQYIFLKGIVLRRTKCSIELRIFSLDKLNTKQLPLPFNDMFVRNDSIHSYLSRQASSFHLPLNRTSFAKKTFVFTGPKLEFSFK